MDSNISCQARLVCSNSNKIYGVEGSKSGNHQKNHQLLTIIIGESFFYVQIFDNLPILTKIFGFSALHKDKMRDVLTEYGEFKYMKKPPNSYGKERRWLNSQFNNIPKTSILYGYFHLDQRNRDFGGKQSPKKKQTKFIF